jgi:peptidoglycan/xylan/chitin deacetylase (PgdA/CDA1 family)
VAKLQSCARIIMYHGVLRRDRSLLVAQLRYFQRHFRIVPLATVVQAVAGGVVPKHNEMALTFDDGLRNNLTVVYPILKQLRVPATFFVCPGLISTGHWLWTHEARCRLTLLNKDEHTLPALPGCPSASTIDGILEWMKTLDWYQRQSVEAKIRQATPHFQPTADDHEAYDVMDWNDLRSLDPELITIGSHTVTHPILSTLDDEATNFEVAESRRQLQDKLNRPVNYFSYPNGANDSQSCLAVKRIYEAAVSTDHGMLTGRKTTELHRLPRICASKDGALMAWRLHRPGA